MAACGLIMSGDNNCSSTSEPPRDAPPQPSSPSTSSGLASYNHRLHCHPHSIASPNNVRTLKKRMASEMDDYMLSTATEDDDHLRFLRRNMTLVDAISPVDGIASGDDIFSSHFQSHNQMPSVMTTTTTTVAANILNHSTNGANLMTMTSLLQSGLLSPAPALNVPFLDSPPLPQLPQLPQPPSVCLFSGLPLFPPEKSRQASAAFPPLLPSPSSLNPTFEGSNVGFPMDDVGSAMAWVDNITKDHIQASTSVSVAQLVQNVKEIIHPGNLNLATVLEHCLHSLNEQPLNPLDMRLLNREPYANAVLLPPQPLNPLFNRSHPR